MGGSEKKFELAGWFLFMASSLFFMASSLLGGDPIGFIGGLLFFIACIAFLLGMRHRRGSEKQ
jgi:multisubunit Na+/H+ antiporter MnhB subunit